MRGGAVGFLGVAGIAIIALYVYAQGRRSRAKDTAEMEPAVDHKRATSEVTEMSNPIAPTGTAGE